ncbi:hypothetical protein V6O07_22625 [Arthrospira platensis SPKY2]
MVFTPERTSTIDIASLERLLLESQGFSDSGSLDIDNDSIGISSPTVVLKPFNLYSHIEVSLDSIKSLNEPSIFSIYKEYGHEIGVNPDLIVDAAITIVDLSGEEEIISVDLDSSIFEQIEENYNLVEIQVWDNMETKG